MWVVNESRQACRLQKMQSFYAKPVHLPFAVADKIYKVQLQMREIEKYLGVVAAGSEVEAPSWLKEDEVTPEVAKESKPKKKATARSSKKKSPTASKKTAASSSTKTQKDA